MHPSTTTSFSRLAYGEVLRYAYGLCGCHSHSAWRRDWHEQDRHIGPSRFCNISHTQGKIVRDSAEPIKWSCLSVERPVAPGPRKDNIASEYLWGWAAKARLDL